MRLIKYNEFLNGYDFRGSPDNHPNVVRNISFNKDIYNNNDVSSISLTQIFSELNSLKNNLSFEKESNKISFDLLNNRVEVFRELNKNRFRFFIKINDNIMDEDEAQIERLFNILFFI